MLEDTQEFTPNGRNMRMAAKRLRDAKDEELRLILRRDPGMIREVANQLLVEIARHDETRCDDDKGCGENPCICRPDHAE
jgi:hypothetical protein